MTDADFHAISQVLEGFGLGLCLSDDQGRPLVRNRHHRMPGGPAPGQGTGARQGGDEQRTVALSDGRRLTLSQRTVEHDARFRLLAEHSTDLIIAVDADLAIRYASPATERMLGCAPRDLHGHTLAELLVPEDRAAFVARHFGKAARHGHGHGPELFRVHWREGRTRWVEVRVASLPPGNGLGDHLVTLRDADQRKHAEEALGQANAELSALASTDALTGLPNRRHFDATLHKEWFRALRDGVPLALLMIDIDRFKALNDLFGHQIGDAVLAQVGRVIREQVRRAGDMAARYGGEEFAVVLPGTGSSGALELAELIRRAVAAADYGGVVEGGHPISVSIGAAASVPLSGAGATALVHQADAALYQAKHHGRNRVEILQ